MVEMAAGSRGPPSSTSCSSEIDQEKQVKKLEDQIFGHLPSKLGSAEVAVGGRVLVDGPLQVEFPGKDKRGRGMDSVSRLSSFMTLQKTSRGKAWIRVDD